MFEAYAHGFGLLTAVSALIGFALVRSRARSSGDSELWKRRERLVRSYMWGAIVVYLLLLTVAKISNS